MFAFHPVVSSAPFVASLVYVVLPLIACATPPQMESSGLGNQRSPNVLLVITDDLGVGEVGCYGQTRIRTPHIDALAADGLRFTQGYSGSCVCAPSRCTLLTGYHTGHSAIRDNKELRPTGQEPLPEQSITIATVLKQRGYATAAIGKWGLGPPGSVGDPGKHGFDLFFGYLCQRHAHNHCPSHLFRNGEVVALPGNKDKWDDGVIVGGAYAPDLFREEALSFIRANREQPFLLLFATPVPHAALQAPEESLAKYRGKFAETPYDGGKGYLKHPEPRAAYAAMVSRMDADVGVLLAELRYLGLERDTIVIFTSDNGPTFNGGTDSAYFESTGGLRGLKCDLYEGGIRVPLVVRWPGVTPRGAVSDAVTANWDWFPTLAAACGVDPSRLPKDLDGVDITPQLRGGRAQPRRPHLYWEYHAGGGWQAVRLGDWKGVRRQAKKQPYGEIELYDLAHDPLEQRNVAGEYPKICAEIRSVMAMRTRSPVPEWNFAAE